MTIPPSVPAPRGQQREAPSTQTHTRGFPQRGTRTRVLRSSMQVRQIQIRATCSPVLITKAMLSSKGNGDKAKINESGCMTPWLMAIY